MGGRGDDTAEVMKLLSVMSGNPAEGIFTDGISAEGVFAERNFRRKEISPNGIFAEPNFR